MGGWRRRARRVYFKEGGRHPAASKKCTFLDGNFLLLSDDILTRKCVDYLLPSSKKRQVQPLAKKVHLFVGGGAIME